MKTAFEHKPDFRLRDFVIEKTVTAVSYTHLDVYKRQR